MLIIEEVDTKKKDQVRRFVRIPYRLYKNHPQWVPPLFIDAEMFLNREQHPYYEHSTADFFIANRDGQDVGRIAVLMNTPFNDYHKTHQAQFYLFDCVDDQEAVNALFERAIEWARTKNLNRIVGPKGFGPLDGYGLLVDGYEHRQVMTMMNYNYPYYQRLIENMGFSKEVDFISCYIDPGAFRIPERVHRIAERVQQRGTLSVLRFKNKRELKSWVNRIGKAYNQAFIRNWEYYPLSEGEINFVVSNILVIADPRLIKVIIHDEDVVGFLFAFPDISAALQRAGGHLLPFGLPDLLVEMRRTKWVALNGMGILEEFQGHGGNALLYSEMEKTFREFDFQHADLTQVAETAVQMRKDLENLGGVAYKNHRVYAREL
jgi:hypothetical protein